jgi:hypothetical protein
MSNSAVYSLQTPYPFPFCPTLNNRKTTVLLSLKLEFGSGGGHLDFQLILLIIQLGHPIFESLDVDVLGLKKRYQFVAFEGDVLF